MKFQTTVTVLHDVLSRVCHYCRRIQIILVFSIWLFGIKPSVGLCQLIEFASFNSVVWQMCFLMPVMFWAKSRKGNFGLQADIHDPKEWISFPTNRCRGPFSIKLYPFNFPPLSWSHCCPANVGLIDRQSGQGATAAERRGERVRLPGASV